MRRILWEKEEELKLSGNNRQRRLIWEKVDLYEVYGSFFMYCLLFYFKIKLTPFSSHQISGISLTRGKQFRRFWTQGFESEADKNTDEWCRAKLIFDGFNTAYKNIAASFFKVGDESMSAIRFRTTAKGNLPHLSYIFRKPDPLGT